MISPSKLQTGQQFMVYGGHTKAMPLGKILSMRKIGAIIGLNGQDERPYHITRAINQYHKPVENYIHLCEKCVNTKKFEHKLKPSR